MTGKALVGLMGLLILGTALWAACSEAGGGSEGGDGSDGATDQSDIHIGSFAEADTALDQVVAYSEEGLQDKAIETFNAVHLFHHALKPALETFDAELMQLEEDAFHELEHALTNGADSETVAGLAMTVQQQLGEMQATLSAAGSGASDASARSMQPIEDILSKPIEIADLTASSAVVRVDTTIDVMCSVVYGTDESYGNQSTDPDMGGLPHKEHTAPLRGLQPDTVYHYRLQGTAPDGTVYTSDDLTFSTPAMEGEAEDYGENVATLAIGASVADVSSVFGDSDTWAASNAIDGDPSTQWSSAGDGDAAFVTIDLAERYDLTAVGLWTRTMGNSAQMTRFQVVTEDGTVLGPFDLPDASRMYSFPVSAGAQQLRFEVVASSGGNTGAVEVAAFTGQ